MDFSPDDLDGIPSLDDGDGGGGAWQGGAASGQAEKVAPSGGLLDAIGGMTVSKVLILGVAVPLILAVLAGIYMLLPSGGKTEPAKETTEVNKPAAKKPVPMPYHTEMMRLLIYSEAGDDKDFMELELQLVFFGEEGRDYYKSNELLFRNSVYDFMLLAKPKSNSWGGWNEVVSGELLGFLKERFPSAHVAKLTLEQAKRL